jgi:G3E family GTPase
VTDGREGRMRLVILGGYLGSGKTTWLRHQLHARRFKDAFIVVNEAAEAPVDDALLQGAAGLAVLAGGCACCAAKAEMVALLRGLCDARSRRDAGARRLSEIVLETSGLADPAPIAEAIRADPVLVHHIFVGEIIVAVDALHGLAQLLAEPLGRRQAEIADRIVVTKIDAARAAELAPLLATLRGLNPGAAISGAVKGTDAPLPPFADTSPAALPDLSGAEAQPLFPVKLSIGGEIDWTAFTVWLSALLHARGDDVVRVKGVVRTPAGRLLLQSVRRVVQSPEVLPEQPDAKGREDNAVIVIGRGYGAQDLERSLRRFAAG